MKPILLAFSIDFSLPFRECSWEIEIEQCTKQYLKSKIILNGFLYPPKSNCHKWTLSGSPLHILVSVYGNQSPVKVLVCQINKWHAKRQSHCSPHSHNNECQRIRVGTKRKWARGTGFIPRCDSSISSFFLLLRHPPACSSPSCYSCLTTNSSPVLQKLLYEHDLSELVVTASLPPTLDPRSLTLKRRHHCCRC
jgi:hypothetical protein